jgi:hypothetical protein
MTMSYAFTLRMTFLRRRVMAMLVVALVAAAAALAAASTSARQTLVRAHIARDGSVVVSGYDGGAPLAPATKP